MSHREVQHKVVYKAKRQKCTELYKCQFICIAQTVQSKQAVQLRSFCKAHKPSSVGFTSLHVLCMCSSLNKRSFRGHAILCINGFNGQRFRYPRLYVCSLDL